MERKETEKELLIHVDDKEIQPPKKILTCDQLLELAGFDDPVGRRVFLVDGEGRRHQVETDEALELQNGMRFETAQAF